MDNLKVVIFSLTRKGCLEYSLKMISFIDKPLVFLSNLNVDASLPYSKKIDTYSNIRDFIISTLKFVFKGYAIVRNLKNEYKNQAIVFYFPVFHPWNLIILFYSKLYSIRSILTIHDYDFHFGEKSKIAFYIQYLSAKLANNLIFLSFHERNKVENKSILDKIHIVNHPYLDFQNLKTNFEYREKPRLLFLGRLSMYKGIDILIKAFPCIVNHIEHLTVAGELIDTSIKLPAHIKIKKKLNYLSDEEIYNLLATHDILILPYIDASQSGILTIGRSVGIPMIISDLPGLREQLGENQAYWIKAGLSESIMDAILWYAQKENYNLILQNMDSINNDLNIDIKRKINKILTGQVVN